MYRGRREAPRGARRRRPRLGGPAMPRLIAGARRGRSATTPSGRRPAGGAATVPVRIGMLIDCARSSSRAGRHAGRRGAAALEAGRARARDGRLRGREGRGRAAAVVLVRGCPRRLESRRCSTRDTPPDMSRRASTSSSGPTGDGGDRSFPAARRAITPTSPSCRPRPGRGKRPFPRPGRTSTGSTPTGRRPSAASGVRIPRPRLANGGHRRRRLRTWEVEAAVHGRVLRARRTGRRARLAALRAPNPAGRRRAPRPRRRRRRGRSTLASPRRPSDPEAGARGETRDGTSSGRDRSKTPHDGAPEAPSRGVVGGRHDPLPRRRPRWRPTGPLWPGVPRLTPGARSCWPCWPSTMRWRGCPAGSRLAERGRPDRWTAAARSSSGCGASRGPRRLDANRQAIARVYLKRIATPAARASSSCGSSPDVEQRFGGRPRSRRRRGPTSRSPAAGRSRRRGRADQPRGRERPGEAGLARRAARGRRGGGRAGRAASDGAATRRAPCARGRRPRAASGR